MSTEPRHFAAVHEQAQRVLWAFGLNVPPHPEGEPITYACPAEAYLASVRFAVLALGLAKETALAEIPERIKARGAWLEKSHLSVVEEMATVEPEVRRLWAVRAAHDLVKNLYEALQDEARPHQRVMLPEISQAEAERMNEDFAQELARLREQGLDPRLRQERATTGVRWLFRNGASVLQQQWAVVYTRNQTIWRGQRETDAVDGYEWRDVPVVEE